MRRGSGSYRFFGANVWYLANLGAPKSGDKARLERELDRLSNLGVTSVRLMAGSEGPDSLPSCAAGGKTCQGWCDEAHGHCNWKGAAAQLHGPFAGCSCAGCPFCSAQTAELGPERVGEMCPEADVGGSGGPSAHMVPAMQTGPGQYNEDVLRGLDHALHALSKRRMTAVLCLNNMWQWSGGLAAYVEWATGEPRPCMPVGAQDKDWQAHQNFAIRFYELPEARRLFLAHVKHLLLRTNTANGGRQYRDDPTIMAWQLANEPRPLTKGDAYRAWISESARFIKELDCNHMVTVGSEGPTPWPTYVQANLRLDHSDINVDYATIHVWPQNWGWFSPTASPGSKDDLEHAWAQSIRYIDAAVADASAIGKPLVIEEFGLARDGDQNQPGGETSRRDRFYEQMCTYVASKSATVSGLNFWAWGGEGRPRGTGAKVIWKPGDPWTGDPPHENQGWYSVYDMDQATHEVIARCAHLYNT